MSSGGFGPSPKKETVYSGPSPPQSGNTGYGGATSKPAGETVYGGPNAPGGTVYNPARQNNANAANAAQNEKVGKAANIFYLIAGLSLVNTFLAISGVNLALALGLGITRIFDQALKSGGSAGPVLVVNAAVAGVFVAIGVFAKRGSSAAFLIGLLLYAGDAVLLCIDGVLIHIPSIIVHGIFLAGLFGGYRLTRE